MRLKKLSDQVIVITGASSGIGLSTARRAAERGARVVLAARSEEALCEAAEKLRSLGGRASHVVADVSDPRQVQRILDHALQTYGRVDTWVNNAAVGIYGRVEDVSIEDMRRLFDVAFWGTVYGSRVALPHLKQSGGALINVGSIESDTAMPFHSAYAAAKHAIRAFTNTLRLEIEREAAPVSVTLIKPAAIDTPFFEHARNYLNGEPDAPPPFYSPEVVADAILHSAVRPRREIVVGGSGRVLLALSRAFPRASDRVSEALLFRALERHRRPSREPEGALYAPLGRHGQERGNYPGHVMKSSLYTKLSLHPGLALASLGLGVLGTFLWLRS